MYIYKRNQIMQGNTSPISSLLDYWTTTVKKNDSVIDQYNVTGTTSRTYDAVLGYDPLYANRSDLTKKLDQPPVIKNLSFSASNYVRNVTISFSSDDIRPKNILVYYYRETTVVSTTTTSSGSGDIGIIGPDGEIIGGSGSTTTTSTSTSVDDDFYSINNTTNTSVTIDTMPRINSLISNYDTGSYSSGNGYFSARYANSRYRNIMIAVCYTGENNYSYYFKHYAVNSAT